MTLSALMNPVRPPTEEEIARSLGPAAPLWRELVTRLTREYGGQMAFRWEGARNGWCVPVKRAGRALVTLTPRYGAVRAMVVLGRQEADLAGALALGGQVREAFQTAPQLRDGRWLFLTIASEDDLHDLLALLVVKLPPTVRRRLEASAMLVHS